MGGVDNEKAHTYELPRSYRLTGTPISRGTGCFALETGKWVECFSYRRMGSIAHRRFSKRDSNSCIGSCDKIPQAARTPKMHTDSP
ncbi:hypothetical protein P171DRAFT_428301 [Karstenula rhodostoma CBS 690.94]|uniref:Uncharacterized protein n=1 Tax=Karstenula rhodostoma CBS 690.94 TaxID=1392251 RepID=A0A9P4UDT8_9PLEO|nr:hypothetical protein P171DRAFT_428301 [Karstenula rhodostoma CBS 690.94]